MWAVCTVVDTPCLNDPAGRSQAAEQMLIQALVPQPPVEALDESLASFNLNRRGPDDRGQTTTADLLVKVSGASAAGGIELAG